MKTGDVCTIDVTYSIWTLDGKRAIRSSSPRSPVLVLGEIIDPYNDVTGEPRVFYCVMLPSGRVGQVFHAATKKVT